MSNLKATTRPEVLYVTHRTPWPPDRGDRIRTWNILRFLSRRADVDLLCLADEPVSSEAVDRMQAVTRRLAVVPHVGAKRYWTGLKSLIQGRSITEGMFHSTQAFEILQEWAGGTRWDAALASSSGVAAYISQPWLNRSARCWVDLIDVDSEKWLDYSKAASFPGSLLFRIESRRLRQTECQLAASCQRLTVVSEAERDLFRSFSSTDRIQAIPNGVDTDYFTLDGAPADSTQHPPRCVFVGVMNYKPNADAVRWFASEVWPAIRQRFPGAMFHIVGKSPTNEVMALSQQPGIEVTGAVPDVRPWIQQAHCAVVPLQIARGIQNKVLEAMACGRPVVCSSAPLKGLQAEPGVHVLQANTASEWIETLTQLFQQPELQAEYGLAAATWVRLHHSWDACLQSFCEMLPEQHSASSQSRQFREAEVVT